jgi:hypothetical protein
MSESKRLRLAWVAVTSDHIHHVSYMLAVERHLPSNTYLCGTENASRWYLRTPTWSTTYTAAERRLLNRTSLHGTVDYSR